MTRPTAHKGPFPCLGHRTMRQVMDEEEAARAKWREQYAQDRASLDPYRRSW